MKRSNTRFLMLHYNFTTSSTAYTLEYIKMVMQGDCQIICKYYPDHTAISKSEFQKEISIVFEPNCKEFGYNILYTTLP